MATKKKPQTKIVWFEPFCCLATLFKSEEKAALAAEEYGRDHGYSCEAVPCNREHINKSGSVQGSGWHVRGVHFH
jgi:hypothetical protein